MSKNFYITTTLPYVNAPLHMGHALEFVRADSVARYKKLSGYDVFFNTGTDEHGIKIYNKATENNLSPQEFVNKNFEVFKEQLKTFGISNEVHFIRTTDKHHESAAQEFWKRVNDNGYIYKANYEAKYCVGCEAEKTESELDENGLCPLHPGIELETINEENYFFKQSALQDKLLKFYEENPNFVLPDFRYNEIKNFVKNGLQDISISRNKEKLSWGIPVPGDDSQVMYVWFDALTNYINTLGWPDENGNFDKYWVNGTPTQYCGKDNTRFQGVLWQTMLLAAGLPNSKKIVVNGFITGDKGIRMSKTIGNVVDPRDIANEYGVDALRYFLLREVSSFEDSPFTLDRFKDAYNAGLANGIGNLTSRIMKMATTNIEAPIAVEYSPVDENFSHYMEAFDIQKAMDVVFAWVGELDKEIQTTEPFKLIKTDPERAKEIIIGLVKKLAYISQHLEPLLPDTAQKIINLIINHQTPSEPLFARKD